MPNLQIRNNNFGWGDVLLIPVPSVTVGGRLYDIIKVLKTPSYSGLPIELAIRYENGVRYYRLIESDAE